MKPVITSVIDIDATPQEVWDVLTDFASYGEWSTFTAAEGTAHVGSRLTMRMPGMTFRPTVTVATPGQQLRWEGTIAGRKPSRPTPTAPPASPTTKNSPVSWSP